MLVKDIMQHGKGNYTDCEVWAYRDRTRNLHSDFIKNIDATYMASDYESKEAADYYLMGESDYNASINANTSVYIDFNDIYGDSNAIVLVIMLPYGWDN